MKKILFLLTIAAVLCQACRKDKNDTTPPSDDGLDLTLDIDWSALDQMPSGLTLMLYPTDGGGASDAPIAHRTSDVSNPKISLPGQNYALICFNQSEAELSDYTFDFSSYATASVTADDPSHLAPLAVASMNSLHPTRALNLMGVLKPTNVVKSMSLKIHVAGLSERAEVRGTLTNMAQGVTLFDRKPLPATIDQPLPPDVWNIALPPDAAQPAELIATFPTFGVFVDDEIRVATRSAADFDLHNILHVTVKDIDDGSIIYEDEIDVTEEVVEQYLASLEEPTAYEAVDLGLSVQWATCNIGASRPEDFGDYLAWGETSAKTTYDWSTNRHSMGSDSTLTKYCNNQAYGYSGFTDNLVELAPSDDAATVHWGAEWRTPTADEWQELTSLCTWTWLSQNGTNGYRITGKNGNCIFLPAAGYLWENFRYTNSLYWSSSIYTDAPSNAFGIFFDEAGVWDGYRWRTDGGSVRGVYSPSKKAVADIESEKLKFRIFGSSATVTGHIGDLEGSVEIPESVTYGGEEIRVTAIGESAFNGCVDITSVTMPNSIKSIGENAFQFCHALASVTLSDSLTSIGYKAFNECPFATIKLPASLRTLESNVFDNCTNLESIEIPEGVTEIKEQTFMFCHRLASVKLPESLTSIGHAAFMDCDSLKSITIPSCVTSIEQQLFYGCRSLQSVNLPDGITKIGHYAFEGCQMLASIQLPNSVTSAGQGTFTGCSSLSAFSFPTSLTSIGDYMFRDCKALASIHIPASVTEIGNAIFYGCSNLAEVTVDGANPNYATSDGMLLGKNDGKMLFYFGRASSLVIPDYVASIMPYAFSGNETLTSLTIPNSVKEIQDWAFGECDNIETLTYDTEAIGSTFHGKHSLKAVNIGNSVRSIGDEAFYECIGLEEITIPASVTSIGREAFQGCHALASVTLPETVTSIGHKAFNECPFTTIKLPASLRTLESNVFDNCQSLTEIELPEGLTEVSEGLFFICRALTTVTIPSTVTKIGGMAFEDCKSLSDVYCYATEPPSFDESSFNGIGAQATLHVPAASVEKYRAAWGGIFANVAAIGN